MTGGTSAASDSARSRGGRSGRPLAAVLLVALMAIGSVVMWLVVPYAWVWLASQMQRGLNPSAGPYVTVAFGVPVSMFALGTLLGWLDRVHSRIVGSERPVRAQLPWMRSLRGERGRLRPAGVLDVVMVWSVGTALLVFGVWFFAFAGSSLPS